jgi:4'-phosphopantetheinyl transferase
MVRWLTRSLADVPDGDEWLTAAERAVLAPMTVDKRRRDWRLGRFAAKSLLASELDLEPSRIEVLAGPSGAPTARVDGEPVPLSITVSHRGDRALAVVAGNGVTVGCDLEVLEPRSDAFVAEWLAPAEQRLVLADAGRQRDLVANLIWTAKEASAKARTEGLRLNVRQALVEPVLDAHPAPNVWHPLRVAWPADQGTDEGFWRIEPGWVMSVIAR